MGVQLFSHLPWDGRAHHLRFRLTEEELFTLKAALANAHSVDRTYHVELTDVASLLHASVEKTIYIARKEGGRRGVTLTAWEAEEN